MASQQKIFVSLVGADPLTRAGIEARLGHRPDIVLTPAPTPDGGVTVIVADEADAAAIHAIRTAPIFGVRRVILLVGRVDDTGLLAAVEAGVSGIVRRNSDAPILELAIRQAAAGDGTLPPDLLGRLLAQVGRLQRQVLSPRGLTLGGLTEREVAVLRLIADGHDTAEVGRELFFSERTVKNIIHDVTTRFELRNRAHAVAYAIREGLI
ncbi:MAG: LuxR C-terminal-related transcriptional regulator [Candidatus Limnocylindrales bacterium]